MYMKNVEMDASIQSLASIQSADYKLPAKIGYAIERNIRMLKNACEEYGKRKEDIIRTYGKDTGEGRSYLDPKKQRSAGRFQQHDRGHRPH